MSLIKIITSDHDAPEREDVHHSHHLSSLSLYTERDADDKPTSRVLELGFGLVPEVRLRSSMTHSPKLAGIKKALEALMMDLGPDEYTAIIRETPFPTLTMTVYERAIAHQESGEIVMVPSEGGEGE